MNKYLIANLDKLMTELSQIAPFSRYHYRIISQEFSRYKNCVLVKIEHIKSRKTLVMPVSKLFHDKCKLAEFSPADMQMISFTAGLEHNFSWPNPHKKLLPRYCNKVNSRYQTSNDNSPYKVFGMKFMKPAKWSVLVFVRNLQQIISNLLKGG